MNTAKSFLLGFALLLPGSGGAQVPHLWVTPSSANADLQRLKTQRAQALTTAVAPINRQYRAALEQLMKATMQRGDLDGAIKVKAAITAVDAVASAGSDAAGSVSMGDPVGAKRFADTRWSRARIRLVFLADGSYTNTWGDIVLPGGKWRAVSPTHIVVDLTNGKQSTFDWISNEKIQSDNKTIYGPTGAEEPTPAKKDGPAPASDGNPAAPADYFGK